MKRSLFLLLAGGLFLGMAWANQVRVIPNVMKQSWSGEHVYMDFPAGTFKGPISVQVTGEEVESRDENKKLIREMKAVEGEPLKPAQLERVQVDGKPVDRVWFIARVVGREVKDSKGKIRRGKPTSAQEVTFFDGRETASSLEVKKEKGWLLVDNGVYEFRLRHYADQSMGQTLGKIRHWLAGHRVKGTEPWDGKAFFNGTAVVEKVELKAINTGPVFHDYHLVFTFADADLEGMANQPTLELGKQSHKWVAGLYPREDVPKKSKHYELKIRFVVNDPWIEVVERYRLPRDEAIGSFGVHQYFIHWGETRDDLPHDLIDIPRNMHMPVDTVTWERWFLYDQFGGNSSQEWREAKPRPDQKGRPFALLRPRWNQGGGGAQDFILTSGGKKPFSTTAMFRTIERAVGDMKKNADKNEKQAKVLDQETAAEDLDPIKKKEMLAEKGMLRAESRRLLEKHPEFKKAISALKKEKDDAVKREKLTEMGLSLGKTFPTGEQYSPDLPAAGIVAAYPSKWVGPYQATIAAYVRPESRSIRAPIIDGSGGGGNDGDSEDNFFGQRSFSINVGPRSRFNNLDTYVRTRVDWTLVALINKYILRWERDESLAGPGILMSQEQVDQLQEEYKSGKDTPAMRALRAFEEKMKPTLEKAKALREVAGRSRAYSDQAKKIDGQAKREKDPAKKKALQAESSELKKKARSSAGESKKASNDLKRLGKKLGGADNAILALIRGGSVKSPKPPYPLQYLAQRYQDDSNNPTNYGNRRLVNDPFPMSDLSSTTPWGGAGQAAIGYIYTDLDAWPGWQNGWTPGNPNFHTDKYIAAAFAAAAMRDHPHAQEWMDFSMRNFKEDIDKVITQPDGVGYECPGYSGFSLFLQMKTALTFLNSGMGNPISSDDRFKKTARWHRKLITPFDKRLGLRHEAPHGDTHRWTSGFGAGDVRTMAKFFREDDPEFASELMGHANVLPKGKKSKGLMGTVVKVDMTIPAKDPMELDWSSEAFLGFGAILRTGFGTDQETFVSMKVGPTKGHYHNDENAFHYYSDGTPIALDYNCSYHPRGDHAVLHNTVTFGNEGEVKHNGRDEMVRAWEQQFGTAKLVAFNSGAKADLVVTEQKTGGLSMSPVEPHDAEFQRRYPYRQTPGLVVRRWLAMVKHDPSSSLSDYLVVRDETIAQGEDQQVNLHLLAREVNVDGERIDAWGQYDKDMVIFVPESEDLQVDVDQWHYEDEYMLGPGAPYEYQAGETMKQWESRLKSFMTEKGVETLPLPDWKPKWQDPNTPSSVEWRKRIHDSQGKALMPPPIWNEKWQYGETQIWLRLKTRSGSPILWVLYPYKRGETAPTFKAVDGGVVVSLGDETDTIMMAGTGNDVVINGEKLLPGSALPALGKAKALQR